MRWFVTRVAVIALPIVEILLIVWVGRTIGWGWTIVLLLAGLGLGLGLMRNAGVGAFRAVTAPMQRRQPYVEIDESTGMAQTVHPEQSQPSAEEIQEASSKLRASGLLFVAGMLFAIPGFLSDLAGAVLALPPVRSFLAARMPDRPERGTTVIRGETVVMGADGQVVVRTWQSGSAPGTDPQPGVVRGQVLPPPNE